MEALSIRNYYKQCKCNRCGTIYEFESNDIMYDVRDLNDSQQRYTFYLKCDNCGHKIIIHEQLWTHKFPNSDFNKTKAKLRQVL